MSARVFVGDVLVGELFAGTGGAETAFEFDAAYAGAASRPVLGRWFEDQIIDPPRQFRGTPLPRFFRNLLPEGALRKVVERRLGRSDNPEYAMLLRLGQNLPGAVRVVGDGLDVGPLEESELRGREARDPFRFALAGVQPKLALAELDDRLTLPLEGAAGHWIAKLGSAALQHLADNECAMLDWAAACGLDVPEHRLISSSEIENYPDDFETDQRVLIVRRFDRRDGRRIHQEDFAQVFDIAPEERYAWEAADLGWAHYGSIGAVVHALCGESDYREYLRRLVFMVLSGNADAHLKNWGLVYPDGVKPRLAPVYDFVSTVVYSSFARHTGLRWSEPTEPTIAAPRELADVSLDDLLGAASYSNANTADIMDDLVAFAEKVRDTWPEVDAPPIVRERVTAHLSACALR
jgi:serine/threonine-protein kinase HipA